MKTKKLLSYLLGGTCACAFVLGMIFLIPVKEVTVSAAIVMICLSLAIGMLIPNPVSFVCLIAGICALVMPAWVVGLIMLIFGIGGAIGNLIASKKAWKLF